MSDEEIDQIGAALYAKNTGEPSENWLTKDEDIKQIYRNSVRRFLEAMKSIGYELKKL